MRAIDKLDGFKIGGKVANNLYADDTVILAESEEQLKQLINVVVTEGARKDNISPVQSHSPWYCQMLK